MRNTFPVNQCYPLLMGVTFFKAFPDIIYITEWFKEIVYNNKNINFSGTKVDSKTSNLSYFNIEFFLKAFPDISQNG